MSAAIKKFLKRGTYRPLVLTGVALLGGTLLTPSILAQRSSGGREHSTQANLEGESRTPGSSGYLPKHLRVAPVIAEKDTYNSLRPASFQETIAPPHANAEPIAEAPPSIVPVPREAPSKGAEPKEIDELSDVVQDSSPELKRRNQPLRRSQRRSLEPIPLSEPIASNESVFSDENRAPRFDEGDDYTDGRYCNSDIDGCFAGTCGSLIDCCPWNLGTLFELQRYEFFFGTQAYSGQPNYPASATERGLGGSFGIHEGFNFASHVPFFFRDTMTGQFGLRATQSQWSGSDLDPGRRNQVFLTGAIFRRVDYGLQGGVAVDYLNDRSYYDANLVQLRGELSFVMSSCDDFGFRFASSLQDDIVLEQIQTAAGGTSTVTSNLDSLETYRFFYRRKLGASNMSTWSVSAGWTGDRDGLLDSTLEMPIHGSLGMRTAATYLSPTSDATLAEQRRKAWSLSISFVVTPRRCFGTGNRFTRPFFDVADNGSFLLKRLP